MNKTRALLLCSTAAILTFGAAGEAATPAAADSTAALGASSYVDLFEPIPNAVALLNADNLARAQQAPQARIQLARDHHHHSYHHHHSHFPWGVFRGVVAPPAGLLPRALLLDLGPRLLERLSLGAPAGARLRLSGS